MTLHGSKDTYVKTGENYIESGVHVLDVKEGDLTSSVTTSGSVDTSKPGDYTVTYTVRNAAGMEDSIERTVHVTDDMAWDSDGISVLLSTHKRTGTSNLQIAHGNTHATTQILELIDCGQTLGCLFRQR